MPGPVSRSAARTHAPPDLVGARLSASSISRSVTKREHVRFGHRPSRPRWLVAAREVDQQSARAP